MSKKLKKAWYALHTRSRFENVVSEGLTRKSFEVFLPKIKVRSKRKDRKKMIEVPLFPGYLFVKTNLDPREHLEIIRTIGTVRLIGAGDRPVSVPSDSMESLMIMVSGDQEIFTGTLFEQGARIMVTGGPFAGVIGTFIRYKGHGRVLIYIGALGQYAAVEVDEENINALPEM